MQKSEDVDAAVCRRRQSRAVPNILVSHSDMQSQLVRNVRILKFFQTAAEERAYRASINVATRVEV